MHHELSFDFLSAASAASASHGLTLSLHTPRVLHVDGDSDTALVLSTLLVPETHVTHVPTLAAAVQAIENGQFELVVLDPDLPDGDGATLVAMLRRIESNARVLLYSARVPDQPDVASPFLAKPWTSPRQLWRTVSGLLGIGPLGNALAAPAT